MWLGENPDVIGFVVIDDAHGQSFGTYLPPGHWVETVLQDKGYEFDGGEEGLTEAKA